MEWSNWETLLRQLNPNAFHHLSKMGQSLDTQHQQTKTTIQNLTTMNLVQTDKFYRSQITLETRKGN